MTYEELIAECKRLRSAYEHARSEYFLFLMRAEREMRDIWVEAGHATFDSFLRSNDLTDREHYITFVRGVEKVGTKDAVKLGAPLTIAAGVMSSLEPRAVEKLRERGTAFVKVHETPPSQKTVDSWRQEIAREEQPRQASIVRKASELDRLREENKKLKADLAAAKARIEELEAQLEGSSKKKRKAA